MLWRWRQGCEERRGREGAEAEGDEEGDGGDGAHDSKRV